MHKSHGMPEASEPGNSDSNALRYLSPADYLEQRVEDQLRWYEIKSADNKRWYYRLQIITLFSAVTVPILALLSGDIRVRFLVAVMGAVAALAAGVLSMYQFRDQWLDYRSTAESLKLEKHLFLTRTEPYANDNAFALLVQRIEAIIISENRSWQDKSFDLPQSNASDAREDSQSDYDMSTNDIDRDLDLPSGNVATNQQ